ncbi:SOS response-associated peptidase [Aneurinibacillus migulanus]|uniref:SOS response-associated peptidase n=1 Tax=Aneurinibacillus migulanus TaxID=47500 RepID=UPI002E24EE44|nr:SOS response-associated peptidase [Aneurinibacillus migulanus]
MCGRFTLFTPLPELLTRFSASIDPAIQYQPQYNIAPSQSVLAVVEERGRNIIKPLKWGLIPHWAQDPKIGYKMINARAETIDEKASFKTPFWRQRCLILSNGFYEWKKVGKGKTPIRFRLKGDKPFAFAGLWERWKSDEGEEIYTCTIITTEPNDLTREVHNRMPVILHAKSEKIWLDSSVDDAELLKSLLIPYPSSEMEAYEVSNLVNSPKNTGAEFITPLNSL